jgi:hypothetical protein
MFTVPVITSEGWAGLLRTSCESSEADGDLQVAFRGALIRDAARSHVVTCLQLAQVLPVT